MKKGEGMKQKQKLIDTGNSMVITRGEGEWGQVKEGKGEINGDRRRLDCEWWTHNIQMMCYRIVYLKPVSLY